MFPERKHLKKNISGTEGYGKGQFWKGKIRKGQFGKENSGNVYFCKAKIRIKTIRKRTHLKKDSSGK